MSIQGGGKLPHARTTSTDRPRRAAEKRQAREADAATETRSKDVFETGAARGPAHTPPGGLAAGLPTGQKLDEALGHPSQIKQMAEAITAHARRLGSDFDILRGEAQQVVNRLAQQGFSPNAVADTRSEVASLRKQMAHLRGKIAADGRRLKLLKAAASKLGESKLSDKVGTQLKKIAEMERGWGRAFLALGIAGTFSSGPDAESRGPARLQLSAGASVDRHALGGYLSQVAPGTAASQLLVALLEEGPHAPPGRLIAEAYAELHADVLAGRLGKALQGLGLWRQAMG